jgi:hypothetical protein
MWNIKSTFARTLGNLAIIISSKCILNIKQYVRFNIYYVYQFVYLFIYLLCFASEHHTTIAVKKLGHHNSLTPITVGPLQNININIENRNN